MMAMVGSSSTSNDSHRHKMKSRSYGEKIVQGMQELRQNDELCDFTVSADGKSIKVHKILLAATSDYFRAMLQGPMRESQEDFVDLKGLNSDSLELIINFIYSGTMEFDAETLEDILNAASHLQVQSALDLCSDYIISLLNFSNADDFVPIAETYSLQSVIDFYNSKVLNNFEEFTSIDRFLRLSPAQLMIYLSNDGLVAKSEVWLYDMIAKWYSHDQIRRLDSLDGIMKCIRYALMTEAQLNALQQHWLTGQCVISQSLIRQGLKYHQDCAIGHPSTAGHYAKIRSKKPSLTLIHQGSSNRPFEITAYDQNMSKFFHLVSDYTVSRDCRVAVADNFLYICRLVDCGGGALMNSMLRFDPRHLSLQELMPCSQLRIDPALAVWDHCLYLIGGTNEQYSRIFNSMECYNIRTNTWIDLPPLPHVCHSHSATFCQGLLYVSGGIQAQEDTPTTAMHCYDPASQRWQSKASMYCARRLHDMTVLESKLFVLGGIDAHSYHQQIPMESFDINTNQWTVLSSTLAGRCVGHFLTLDSRIISIGREHYKAAEDEIWEYDLESDSWSTYINVPRQLAMASTSGAILHLSFSDEAIAKRGVKDKR